MCESCRSRSLSRTCAGVTDAHTGGHLSRVHNILHILMIGWGGSMQSRQGSVLEALRRVQGFLDANATVVASINQSSLRQKLDETVTQLTAHAVAQENGGRGSTGETARQRTLRLALRLEMRPFAEAARLNEADVPELRSLHMPRADATIERLINAARSMAELAGQHEAVLA